MALQQLGHCRKGEAKYHQTFLIPKTEIFSATCHFEKQKKNICLTSYTVKIKSKGKKDVVVLSTSRPFHEKTIDDGKKKVPNNQVLRLHKRWNGCSRADEWLQYHQIKVLPLGFGSLIIYVGYINSEWESLVVFEKWFRYFKHIFIWHELEFGIHL